MYAIVYGILYAFSLLPLRVLYLFSSFAYFIIYHVIGYRKKIVLDNLAKAFPEKSEKELISISKKFYLNLTDTFIESLKMMTISKKEIMKRSVADTEYINSLIDKGLNVHIMIGHQFNWEFSNLVYSIYLHVPFVIVYMPITNKYLDKIFYKFRSRYGSVLVSATNFRSVAHNVFKNQYVMALGADQNPGNPAAAFWLNFMGRPAPFVKGPAKGAIRNNTAVVFVGFRKVKRGHYIFTTHPVVENAANYSAEELTLKYRDVLEQTIRQDPSNYLWSHRRWKYDWKPEYGKIIG